jgi:hypothetical protein
MTKTMMMRVMKAKLKIRTEWIILMFTFDIKKIMPRANFISIRK